MSNNTAIKSIAELKDFHFLVEDYQRGYKWTKTEVEQLLNDINEFSGNSNEFYCLQPIVVKNVIDNEKDKTELIDGQQRTTTIYIILSYLGKEKYSIDYRTRESSKDFLSKIKENVENKTWISNYEGKEMDNIDNYYFFNAYETVKKWFGNKSADKEAFHKKLTEQVKVIWYEVPNIENSKQESIKIFTRINSGKIPLTNAELIKALFLINVQNDKNAEILQLKQNEIAQQWDNIEYTLQDDAFWSFISNDKPTATRIDFIFDLIADKNKNEKDKYSTFLSYNENFAKESNKQTWVETEWQKVRITFQTLQEWYENRELYHLIGFLIWKGEKVSDILSWKKGKTKKEFKQEIINHAKITFKPNENLETIEFGDSRIKSILLLHNIATLLESETSNNFSFTKFKGENWDIEHIHAQQSQAITQKKDWLIWITETKAEVEKVNISETTIKEEIVEKLKVDENTLTQDIFDTLFNDVIEFYNKISGNKNEINGLANLVLLDAGTNRSYKNAIFSVKRNKIIAQDTKGVFIPICTKNVFLKYYSKDISQMFLWTDKDSQEYLSDIENKLKPFIS
ncbi:MAG: DUF262 domain-containing protein [Bacteroidetes bacterium]|nr:MAG: DUF262 domain-containing protein [Bacteroidota bacterium]